MEVAHPAGVKLTAQLGRDRRGDQLACSRQIVESLEQSVEPVRNAGTAGLCEPACRRDIRNRQDAGDDFRIDTCRGCVIPETEIAFGREEELSDGAVGACVDLPLEIFDVETARRGIRMNLWI